MMQRDILKIDEELCNGCGQCVPNCQEGALQVIDGKVRLVSELMCDGLGACIGHCPEGAITIEKREAEPYNETIVLNHMKESSKTTNTAYSLHHHPERQGGGCPGSRAMVLEREESRSDGTDNCNQSSELRQWPVQMHLINPGSPGFKNSDLCWLPTVLPILWVVFIVIILRADHWLSHVLSWITALNPTSKN